MAKDRSMRGKQKGLQQAASMIFALVAVLPLLIFAYTLMDLGATRKIQAQISLGLALTIALLGFWMFRSVLGRMGEVAQALTAAVEQANRARRAAAAAEAKSAAASAAGVGLRPVPAAAMEWPAPKVTADRGIPGVGIIREFSEAAQTMDVLWQREATAHLGMRVAISVANSQDPLVGTIAEVSDDGLILEQNSDQLAVAYGRITGIDRVNGQH